MYVVYFVNDITGFHLYSLTVKEFLFMLRCIVNNPLNLFRLYSGKQVMIDAKNLYRVDITFVHAHNKHSGQTFERGTLTIGCC